MVRKPERAYKKKHRLLSLLSCLNPIQSNQPTRSLHGPPLFLLVGSDMRNWEAWSEKEWQDERVRVQYHTLFYNPKTTGGGICVLFVAKLW